MVVSGTDLLWGCPQMNFKANSPFNEMRQGFATFKKETRMVQYLPGLFENLPGTWQTMTHLLDFVKYLR
jgi:hypothetical protein